MFKKSILTITIALFVAGSAAAAENKAAAPDYSARPAKKDGFFFKPYLGTDYQFVKYGNSDYASGRKTSDLIDTSTNGKNIHVGARIHQYVGVELGYNPSEKTTKDASSYNMGGIPLGESTMKTHSLVADVMGYYPIAPKTELIGTVGVSYTKAEFSLEPFEGAKLQEWRPRVGGGAQYWLTENLNARALVRYQEANFKNALNEDTVGDAVVVTAGLNWQF